VPSGPGAEILLSEVSDTDKDISVQDGFDLALANRSVSKTDDHLQRIPYDRKERIFWFSGQTRRPKRPSPAPSDSCTILPAWMPVREARHGSSCSTTIHTLRKRRNVEDLRSSWKTTSPESADSRRATSRSIVIANEILTSNHTEDAIFLGKQVMASLSQLDLLLFWSRSSKSSHLSVTRR